jgi:mevalonate kinase
MEKQVLYAHGKLLLTAEYFILDGAVGLALPTKLGQSLNCQSSKNMEYSNIPNPFGTEGVYWQSYDADGSMWFEALLSVNDNAIKKTNDEAIAWQLMRVLQAVRALNDSKSFSEAMVITTHLTFPRQWGLGTSSTLIYNLASLFDINPFDLLKKTFGGSGYDIACAGASKPILYHLIDDAPFWQEIDFRPPFAGHLYFIYLGKKQNSREGIKHYREKVKGLPPQYFDEITALTNAFLKETDIRNFEKIINEHESRVSEVIHVECVKSLIFKDFWGEIKSLGAWGGDFVLATSDRTEAETRTYFQAKGFDTFLTYEDLIL